MSVAEYLARADTRFKAVMAISVLLLVIVGVGIGMGLVRTRSASRLAREWLGHVSSQQYADAYALLGTGYRSSVGLEQFQQAVSANTFLRGYQEFSNVGYKPTRRFGKLSGRIRSDAGEIEAVFHLIREKTGGEKRFAVIGLELDGARALPAAKP